LDSVFVHLIKLSATVC